MRDMSIDGVDQHVVGSVDAPLQKKVSNENILQQTSHKNVSSHFSLACVVTSLESVEVQL